LIRVLYAGGGRYRISPLFLITPFGVEMKGFEYENWAEEFIEGLRGDPEIEVVQMPSWEVHSSFPRTMEELRKYDVLVIEEVEADVFYLYPEFYTPERGKVITLPNRLELIRRWVEDGGGLLMSGGWLTFQGRLGRGLWHGTPVEEALPVEFQEFDDRVETPEGAYLRVVDPEHPLMRGIPWEACPPLLGYNRAKLKPGAKLLATISRAGRAEEDPLIAVWDYGSGRSMAFASDITPHWGTNFIGWDYYKPFWVRAIKWLAGEL